MSNKKAIFNNLVVNGPARQAGVEFGKLLLLQAGSFGLGAAFSEVWYGATTVDGFFLGGIEYTLRSDLEVAFFASEKSLANATFQYSTIAPRSFMQSSTFGRNALQINYQFQPTLGVARTATISSGTEIRIGLVGGQRGMGFGTWLQIHSKTPIKFTP